MQALVRGIVLTALWVGLAFASLPVHAFCAQDETHCTPCDSGTPACECGNDDSSSFSKSHDASHDKPMCPSQHGGHHSHHHDCCTTGAHIFHADGHGRIGLASLRHTLLGIAPEHVLPPEAPLLSLDKPPVI